MWGYHIRWSTPRSRTATDMGKMTFFRMCLERRLLQSQPICWKNHPKKSLMFPNSAQKVWKQQTNKFSYYRTENCVPNKLKSSALSVHIWTISNSAKPIWNLLSGGGYLHFTTARLSCDAQRHIDYITTFSFWKALFLRAWFCMPFLHTLPRFCGFNFTFAMATCSPIPVTSESPSKS